MKRLFMSLVLLAVTASLAIAGGKGVSRLDDEKAELYGGAPIDAIVSSLCNTLVCVQIDEVGEFNIGTADGRSLLYIYPSDPVTSDIRILMDGMVFQLSNQVGTPCNGMAAFQSWTNDGIAIHTYYALNNMIIEVRHTPILFNATAGAILTETFATNLDDTPHNVGFVYQYDTTVDGDDFAELYHGPTHAVVETCYNAPYDVNYWDAFPVSGLIVGRGTFIGGEAVAPDHLAYGAWPVYYNMCKDRVCDGSPYGDSSVLYQWDEDPVPPGATRRVGTYYGVGSIEIAPGELQLSVSIPPIECTDMGISPNPAQVLVNVTNTGNSPCNNITVMLSPGAGPGGMGNVISANPVVIPFLAPGNNSAVPFTVLLSPNIAGGCVNFTATATANDCPTNAIPFCVNIPPCNPCHPTDAIFDRVDIGRSICIELCPDESSWIRVNNLEPGEYPVVSKRFGCWNDYCEFDCEPTTYIQEFFEGEWQFSQHMSWLEIRGDGCACITLDDILPVELNSFSAVGRDGAVDLRWSTASETNLDRYELVRNGQMIAHVSAENSASGATYDWVDGNVINSTTYTYDLVSVDFDGTREVLATRSATPQADPGVVSNYALQQNYPNPFNPETNITFDLVEPGHVTIQVYNLAGQEISTIVSGYYSAGRHHTMFDGTGLSSGVYLYKLTVNGFTAQHKMILMK